MGADFFPNGSIVSGSHTTMDLALVLSKCYSEWLKKQEIRKIVL